MKTKQEDNVLYVLSKQIYHLLDALFRVSVFEPSEEMGVAYLQTIKRIQSLDSSFNPPFATFNQAFHEAHYLQKDFAVKLQLQDYFIQKKVEATHPPTKNDVTLIKKLDQIILEITQQIDWEAQAHQIQTKSDSNSLNHLKGSFLFKGKNQEEIVILLASGREKSIKTFGKGENNYRKAKILNYLLDEWEQGSNSSGKVKISKGKLLDYLRQKGDLDITDTKLRSAYRFLKKDLQDYRFFSFSDIEATKSNKGVIEFGFFPPGSTVD